MSDAEDKKSDAEDKKSDAEDKKSDAEDKKSDAEVKKSLIYYSRIRELLRGVYDGKETKLNVSKDAKEPMISWLESLIALALESLVVGMPHKSKGEHEGELSRKTVKKTDITKGKSEFKKKIAEPAKKKGKR